MSRKREVDQFDLSDEPSVKKITLCDNDEMNENEEALDEVEVDDIGIIEKNQYGIEEYTNKNDLGFVGIIKQRISDFIVNEIDNSGNIVHLTDLSVPNLEKPKLKFDEKNYARVKEILSEDELQELHDFCENSQDEISLKVKAPKDKNDRRLLHDYIKVKYQEFQTNTITDSYDSSMQLIEIYHKSYRGKRARDSYMRSEKMKFNFCNCVLYKDNIDTIQAVNMIAKNLRIQTKRINYAGTKDKRGKTSQMLSFFKIEPSQIATLNAKLNNIKLGNFKISDDGLKLGDLKGNRFTLVLKDVLASDETIKGSIESLTFNGFINYYGLQRFGTHGIGSHEIGKSLLQGKFDDAFDLILKPRVHIQERDEMRAAREIWSTSRDATKACEKIRNFYCAEKFLLMGLSENPGNDLLRAFNYIPRNMRLMYIHAYQSYIWNKTASERVRRHGLRPVQGDLVFDKNQQKETIITLNDENLLEYSIEDIILPLPGFNMIYPKNLFNYIRDLMQKDGINIDQLKNPIKELSLCGDYRKLLTIPKDLEHELVFYKDLTSQIVKSDLDLLHDVQLSDTSTEKSNEHTFKAVVLKFNLPSSCYATMALRELMKQDTSKDYQTSLNK